MNISKALRRELANTLSTDSKKIISRWALQIMKVHGHRKHRGAVPASRHRKGMKRYFNLFVAFLKNRHDTRSLKCLTSLIEDGLLSINTAEDVIHGQMLLRNIITDGLINSFKHDRDKCSKFVLVISNAIDVHVLHISNVYRKKDSRRLHTLVRSGKRMASARGLNRLLEIALDTAIKESNADRASIMLSDKKGVLRINASYGIPDDIVKETEVLIDKSIAGKVVATNKPVIITEGQKVEKKLKRYLRGLRVASAISLPIATENSAVLGVLNLAKFHGKAPFDKEDAELLSILTYETATSIKSFQLLLETEGLYIGTFFALAAALDARDHYTHGHSRKVAQNAVMIARELRLPSFQIDIVRRASLLHDVGKIGIPDRILNKPAKLSKSESEIVKKHPEVAVNILKPIPQLKKLLPAIYHEHERFDGKGYAAGLKGDAIPLEARIIGVADAFDAMTSERPYRKPLSKKGALLELKNCSGSQFDPKVVKAFKSVLLKR